MKKATSYILTFLLGGIFGAFLVFNLWQPKLAEKKQADSDSFLKIKRFDKDFDIRDLKKRPKGKAKIGDQMDQDIDDLRNQMEEAFKQTGNIFKMMEDSIQDSAFDAAGVRVGEVIEKITASSIILEIDVANIDNSTLNIEVKNGQVSISGEARIEEKVGTSTRMMVSSFSRSYPVPRGTDPAQMKTEYKDENTIQLIFPKK